MRHEQFPKTLVGSSLWFPYADVAVAGFTEVPCLDDMCYVTLLQKLNVPSGTPLRNFHEPLNMHEMSAFIEIPIQGPLDRRLYIYVYIYTYTYIYILFTCHVGRRALTSPPGLVLLFLCQALSLGFNPAGDVSMHVRPYVCGYAFTYVCTHACMYVCMHVCIYVCVYVCMYVCMCVYIYACCPPCTYPFCCLRHQALTIYMYFCSEGLKTPKSGYVFLAGSPMPSARNRMYPSYHCSEPHISFFYNSLMVTLQLRILERPPHASNIVGYLPSHLDKLAWTPADEEGYNSIIVQKCKSMAALTAEQYTSIVCTGTAVQCNSNSKISKLKCMIA